MENAEQWNQRVCGFANRRGVLHLTGETPPRPLRLVRKIAAHLPPPDPDGGDQGGSCGNPTEGPRGGNPLPRLNFAYILIAPRPAHPWRLHRSIPPSTPSSSASSTGTGASSLTSSASATTPTSSRAPSFGKSCGRLFFLPSPRPRWSCSWGLGLAVVVDRLGFGAGIIRTLLLTPLMVSGIIVALMSKIVLDPMLGIVSYLLRWLGLPPSPFFGATSTAMGTVIMVDAWWQTAFVFIIVLAGLQSLPQEPIEAARVDGASSLQTFLRVKLPMLRNVLFTILIFRTIDTLKVFDIIFGTTGGRTRRSPPKSHADIRLSQGLQLPANERGDDDHGHFLRHRAADLPALHAPGSAAGRRPMMAFTRRDQVEQALAYVISLLAILLTLFPIVWLLTVSLKTQRDAFAMPPKLLFQPIADHYFGLLERPGFVEAFRNSVSVTVLGVAIAIVVAIFASYGIHRFRFRGKQLFGAWLLLAYMLPEFLFIIPMFALYQRLGMYDTHIGLALVYQVHSLPFAVWLIRSFFKEVRPSWTTPSRIDGCNQLRTLWHVYIPMAAPGIAATAILTAIWIWNELTIALSADLQRGADDHRGGGVVPRLHLDQLGRDGCCVDCGGRAHAVIRCRRAEVHRQGADAGFVKGVILALFKTRRRGEATPRPLEIPIPP